MSIRRLTKLDSLICNADSALKTLGAKPQASRPSPACSVEKNQGDSRTLSDTDRALSASLMRVNHTGEVCAQALYHGQALTAKLPNVREEMEQAAAEETDHLAWCEERLTSLDSQTSLLNPLFYGLSFGMGAAAGLVSDKVSLGFVAATEDQVCQHLKDHKQKLPAADEASHAVIDQMLVDEAKHGQAALDAGGAVFPKPVKAAMALMSRVMTASTARI